MSGVIPTSVAVPVAETDNPIDILDVVRVRLESVSKVLGGENDWLQPQVEQSRKEVAEDIALGIREADEADFDDLILRSEQVDKHLLNVARAVQIFDDAAETVGRIVRAARASA